MHRSRSHFYAIAQWCLYPATLMGAVLTTYILLQSMSPLWAMNVVNLVLALGLLVGELVMPYRAEWGESHDDVPTDLAYVLISLAGLAIAGPLMALFTAASLWLSAAFDVGLWPHHWPLAGQVLLALLMYELGSYALHWLSHHTRLWRLHSVHHSVERLYWLNSMRSHPVDYVLAVATTSGPLLLLGVGAEVFALVTVLGVANMMWQHANIDVRTGVLDYILVTPRIHRWHHSTVHTEQQCNLGAILLVWDLVWGSRLAPGDRPMPDQVGAGTPAPYPSRLIPQLLHPFRSRCWKPDSS